ncbi:hypothetical protein J6590_060086 [Homalodisca vitripennis]|nr:hypothetical protein J6590_060086 [Homalodisca vitripennis]
MKSLIIYGGVAAKQPDWRCYKCTANTLGVELKWLGSAILLHLVLSPVHLVRSFKEQHFNVKFPLKILEQKSFECFNNCIASIVYMDFVLRWLKQLWLQIKDPL